MANSRIFVKGLPPTIDEETFRKHFASLCPVTDIKLLPQRRIGYVGFGSEDDALRAVKYFNKSYMRLSRIAVELADNKLPKPHTNNAISKTIPTANSGKHESNPLKRKRPDAEYPIQHVKISDGVERTERTIQTTDLESAIPDALGQPREEHTSKEDSEHSSAPADASALKESKELPDKPTSDSDWMRSRTSRLLGLLDDDEEQGLQESTKNETLNDDTDVPPSESAMQKHSTPTVKDISAASEKDAADDNGDNTIQAIKESQRLFIRNLSYKITEEQLYELFKQFGRVEEAHVPLDERSGEAKGFAFVLFENAESSIEAFQKLDGTVFQGRLIHIMPASSKRESKLDEYSISKLPVKKQKQIRRKAEASTSTFNWNSLFMNADAVISSISDKLNVPKSELLDPTSSDAAVKQAQAETHLIQETKAFFSANGVDLNAFKNRDRSDTAILVKNFRYGTKKSDLMDLFHAHGEVVRVLMPPSGTIAIVEFAQAPQARAAFATLAYRKLGDSILFLERAPKDLFEGGAVQQVQSITGVAPKQGATDLLQEPEDETTETSTLFVRNLNFATTNEQFRDAFGPLDGFVSARIKTKPDPKNPGSTLSMGFGFVEFRSAPQARAALAAMNGFNLQGYRLLVKASHKGLDAAEERKRMDDAKRRSAKNSKIVIKNLPFETSKKDVRKLFQAYGQLRAVRVPKKFDNSRKGFAFAEFTNAREAESAMSALNNTHLLGRRLVLDYAAGDAEDPEKELQKMQEKVGKQSDNIALQRLANRSERKKFRIGNGDEGEGAD